MSGRGTGLPVSSACQAWRLVVLVTACTARVDRTTDRSSMPPPASAVAASVSPARVRQADLEGERSPGRIVLASFPVSNPERTARTRRWSKALKRPTRPGRAEFRYFRPQGWGKRHAAAPGGPIDAWGMFAATSVVVEALQVDVWRSAEQSVGQSPSDRRGRPVSPSGCESGREVPGGRWNRKRCNGRGDAVRLSARGFFEGYELRRGDGDARGHRIRPVTRRHARKRDEPQDRQQAAIRLRLSGTVIR